MDCPICHIGEHDTVLGQKRAKGEPKCHIVHDQPCCVKKAAQCHQIPGARMIDLNNVLGISDRIGRDIMSVLPLQSCNLCEEEDTLFDSDV